MFMLNKLFKSECESETMKAIYLCWYHTCTVVSHQCKHKRNTVFKFHIKSYNVLQEITAY